MYQEIHPQRAISIDSENITAKGKVHNKNKEKTLKKFSFAFAPTYVQ